jgi:UDP-glucose 4-epimerase
MEAEPVNNTDTLERWANMILITGGGGFIGLNLARDLVNRDQSVLLVRRHTFEPPSFLAPYIGKQVTITQSDITEPSTLNGLIKNYSVDSIIHAAILNETSAGSTLYQAIRVNLQGTADILEAARIFGLKRVTFLSSIAVYMPFSKQQKVLSEDNDLPPISTDWIAGTKKAGEQICQLYAKEYGLSVPIIRPPQVWGPLYWTHRSPIQGMVENAIAGKLTDLSGVYGGGKSAYIYVRDCAKAISLLHLAPSLKYSIYNVSDIENHSLTDFVRAIREVIPGSLIKLGENTTSRDIEFPPMSIDRIKDDVGFVPEYTLNRAVRAYIEWIRDGKYT